MDVKKRDTPTCIYDQDKLKRYKKWVRVKRHGVTEKTADSYAQMMIRAENEGLSTIDEVFNKYWAYGKTTRARLRRGIRMLEELTEKENKKSNKNAQEEKKWRMGWVTPEERLEKKQHQFENDWIHMKADSFVRKYYRGRWVRR